MVSGIEKRRRAAQRDKSNAAYQNRRAEIFEAAGRVFKKKGFQATSLGDVAEAMGTDRANLYYYVSSKQELLDGVVSKPVRNNVAQARAIAATSDTPAAKLRTLIIELMRSYAQHYPFLYVFIQENLSHISTDAEWAQEMRSINREYENIVISIIEAGYADGTIRNVGPAWVVAYGVIGLVAWSNRWYDPQRTEATAEEIANAYADMVIDGLAPFTADRRSPAPEL